ncbi:hypothetical protein N7492_005856 [Penicillium capsulatum]|uniref:Oxidoreductase, short-chain dehydrogenase/reductase family n=1 Tax=Penicillium capsulatum TaxID=69766 RepID=A0A9W9ICM8_9EURO|nr:hypothetical protein N7492_005856 [Penicillium capsulatum]KAJ6135042.1 hypothetical protein N7512_000202 [Penicillium capsulatum]
MPNLNFDPDKDIPDLSGKTIFITGGTNGLGAESALHLAKHNPAHIYISGRNAHSAAKIISQIQSIAPETRATLLECDLASLTSVQAAASRFQSQEDSLDILMCNAGIMAQPKSLTTDGYELQFGTNHLGHALLIKKLLPVLERKALQGGDPRIIILSSQGFLLHPREGIVFADLKTVQDFCVVGPWRRYGQSKLANLLYARELARRYPGILSVAIHPGVVSTGLVGNTSMMEKAAVYASNFGKMLKPVEGAYNQCWAATVARSKISSGMYYEPVGKLMESRLDDVARDEELARKLWEWTDEELREY